MHNGKASAINFELHDPDPGPTIATLEAVAESFRWELHADEGDEDDDEEED